MARRHQTSIVEDLFEMCSTAPWWLGVGAAFLFWVMGLIFAGRMANNNITSGFQPLVKLLFNGLALIALVAAGVSAIKGLFRRKLLDRQDGLPSLLSLPWREFEQLIGEAYRRQGYDVEETGGGGADGGIDLVLRGHGETILVQCKQWRQRQVGVDKVRELFGVVTAERANRGILVTSGNFTNDAQSFKVGKPLVLVDGPALAELVSSVRASRQIAGPGSRPPAIPVTAIAAPSANACPRCGSPMSIRMAKRGANAGSRFYGCTRYPACKGTLPAA